MCVRGGTFMLHELFFIRKIEYLDIMLLSYACIVYVILTVFYAQIILSYSFVLLHNIWYRVLTFQDCSANLLF